MASKKVNKAVLKYGGQEISLSKSKTRAAVRYNAGMKRSSRRKSDPTEKVRDFEIVKTSRGLDSKLDKLRARPDVAVGTHIWVLDNEDNAGLIPTGMLYVEFKGGTSYEKQMEVLDELGLNVRQVVNPEAYRVEVTPRSPNPVKCAVLLQRKRNVTIAEPEFMTKPVTGDFMMPFGAYISTQWHHENTGGQIPIIDIPNAVYGTAHFKKGADAKIRQAWNILQNTGSGYLKIAVIDTGFDTEHPALYGNGSKITNAFNASDRGSDVSPWFQADDGSWGVYSHGTSCAAVAAGALDSEGVLGAAPNARIIPIKLDVLTDDAIRNAFMHALMNNADIISCSLGFPKQVPLSTYVSNAISQVVRQGRNGKGIPVFIAAGNANPNSNNQPRLISDFAAHPDVICVTASNSLDESSSYTFYGPNAFLCAPSNGNDGVGITTATVKAGSGSLQHIYTSRFGGTSSATPLTAGACALMLTANPNLTLSQIRDILHNTVDKIGSGYNASGHSQTLGYGRLNAAKAVQMALNIANGNSGGNTGTGSTTTTTTTPTTTPSTSQAIKGKVISKFLNVRTGPGTNYAKTGQLNRGDVVDLISKVSGFWNIGAGKYVSADYIQVIAQNGAPAPNAGRQGKVNYAYLNVRSGPSTSYPKVGQLQQGQTVNILETSSNGWHRIGTNRWVMGTYIQEV